MATTRKSKKVYARMLIQSEQKGAAGAEEQQAAVYVPVLVNSDVYSDELLKACRLISWDNVPKKRTIVQWDLRRSKILKKLRISLKKGVDKKRITLTVNKTETTLEAIGSAVLALKTLKIAGVEWKIENVIIPPEKVVIIPPDAEPDAPALTK